jgi:6-phosphofructokinase
MKTRIGVLTSGGDCPGLNAVLRGVVFAAEKLGWEVVGFRDGFEGLLRPGNHVVLDRKSVDGIMALGGTILGTTNRGHFVAKVGAGDRTVVPAHVIAGAKKILDELQVKALITVGRRRLDGHRPAITGSWYRLHRCSENDRQRS